MSELRPESDTAPLTIDEVSLVLSETVKQDEAVKKILFLAMLLAYTEDDQMNIIMTGESSIGKSWAATHIADLYPKDDVEELAYSSPSAFFYDKGTWDSQRKVNVVSMERKILIWLDMPHPQTLVRLRPMLAHDRKTVTYKATDRREKYGMNTKTIEIVGYFSTIFCGSAMDLDPQERTRAFLLSPEDTAAKIEEAIRLKALRDADPERFELNLKTSGIRQALRRRIVKIRDLKVRHVKVPFAEDLAKEWIKEHPNLKPRDTRDFSRLLSITKGLALLNAFDRDMDGNHDITAKPEDGQEAKRLYNSLSESNELGLAPHTFEFYKQLIIPLGPEGATKTEVSQAYYKWKHRSIGERRLESELKNLLTVGLISIDESHRPFRYQASLPAKA
jgi:hypothetical protein